MYIRKEKNPVDTVNYIKSILRNLDICVVEKDIIGYADKWYSLRLEIEELNGIGTNGKGISLEAARASAYAELMERLQSGFLLSRLFKKCNPRTAEDVFSYEETIELLTSLNMDQYLKNYEIRKSLIKNRFLREKQEYYNVNKKEKTYLPNWFIETDCGTNGLCAGNTAHEAILQGINEIQERYVRKKLFLGEIDVPTIEHSFLKNFNSLSIIKAIEQQGYMCIVKDLTCNGKFPVLGVILIEPSMNNYVVAMGADYDIDICLQRCITEVFQGRNFSFLSKQNIVPTFDPDSFFISTDNLESNNNYQMSVVDNGGSYPFNIFGTQISNGEFLTAFVKGETSNEKLLEYAIKQLVADGKDIFIKDYGYLGFPTYRVYIPGMSELCAMSAEMIEHLKSFDTFDSFYYQFSTLSYDQIRSLGNSLFSVMSIPFYQENLQMDLMTGIPIDLSNYDIDLNSAWVFLMICSLKLKHYKEASEYFRKFIKRNNMKDLSENYQVLYIVLEYLAQGKTKEEALKASAMFDKNNFSCVLLNLEEIISVFPKCPECNKCNLIEKCCYRKWNEINDRLKKFGKRELSE